MPESDSAAVEWIIANTINETARGDPHALASRIVAALAAAGFLIVSAKVIWWGRGGGTGRRSDRRSAYRFSWPPKYFPKLPPDQERE